MSRQTENYEALAAAAGLRYDALSETLYGQMDGFDVAVYAAQKSYPYMLTVHTAARNASGGTLDKNTAKEFAKSVKAILKIEQDGNHITIFMKNQPKQPQLQEELPGAVRQALSWLRSRGYTPCCSLCGKEEEVGTVLAGGGYYHLCPDCETMMQGNLAALTQQKQQKRENIVGGIVGALLGSLLGVLCIILLSQMGYVAALSGAVMAVGVLKGYELLGGKMTKKGVVICVLIMLLMTYLGDRLDWAIALLGEGGGAEAGFNLFECYRLVPYMIEEELIDVTQYAVNLLMIYAFLLLGAVPIIRDKVKEKKEETKMRRLGSVGNSFGGFQS